MSVWPNPNDNRPGPATKWVGAGVVLAALFLVYATLPDSDSKPTWREETCLEAASKILTVGREHFPAEYERAIAEIGYSDLEQSLAMQLDQQGADCLEVTVWDNDEITMLAGAWLSTQFLPHNW